MKFWAKVRFKEERNAEQLIRAFFREFNAESSIVIRGKDAKVEIIFNNEPPIKVIEAINLCDILEFNFGKSLGEYSEDEIKEVVNEEKITENIEQPPKKSDITVIKNVEPQKVVKVETVNVPKLEEIAKKATSFEHFVKLVAEWLEMDKKQELFVNLVIVGTEVEKISWKELEKAMKDKGVSYNQYDKICIGNKVSEKFKYCSVKILSLIKAMVQYKDYSFGCELSDQNSTDQITEEMTSDVEQELLGKVENVTPKKRVRMECMPEIPHLEETLGSVDKTQPIEDRVRYVLTAMGWKKKNAQEQQEIFEIANTAVRIREMNFDIIFLMAKMPTESSVKARMTFSKFINDFVIEYDSDKKVKLLDFLKQLQKIIMDESEIEI